MAEMALSMILLALWSFLEVEFFCWKVATTLPSGVVMRPRKVASQVKTPSK